MAWLGGIRLDLLPKVQHVRVDDPVGYMRLDSPGQLDESRAAEDAALVRQEDGQQTDLLCRQFGCASGSARFRAVEVQLAIAGAAIPGPKTVALAAEGAGEEPAAPAAAVVMKAAPVVVAAGPAVGPPAPVVAAGPAAMYPSAASFFVL
jgi:hypothetical protein